MYHFLGILYASYAQKTFIKSLKIIIFFGFLVVVASVGSEEGSTNPARTWM